MSNKINTAIKRNYTSILLQHLFYFIAYETTALEFQRVCGMCMCVIVLYKYNDCIQNTTRECEEQHKDDDMETVDDLCKYDHSSQKLCIFWQP